MISRKIELYLRAALGTRSLNLRGLPLLPKAWLSQVPHNRAAYNEFVVWIGQLLQLRTAQVIFDVGANHGDFSQSASTCFPQSRIWLFEPMPALRPVLEERASRHGGRWNVQPLALGSQAARLPLHVDAANDTIGSFVGFDPAYRELNPDASAARLIEVPVETLDGFCKRENITHIDLMKIDVEGFEFDVLDGGCEMLARTSALIIEVSLVRTAGGSPKPLLKMIERLTLAGFYIVGLIPLLNTDGNDGEPWRPMEYNVLARRSAREDAAASLPLVAG